jgi:hypothetical protein
MNQTIAVERGDAGRPEARGLALDEVAPPTA